MILYSTFSSSKVCFYLSKYCLGTFKVGQEVKANIVPVTVPAASNKVTSGNTKKTKQFCIILQNCKPR